MVKITQMTTNPYKQSRDGDSIKYSILALILILTSIGLSYSEVTKTKTQVPKQAPKKVDMSNRFGLGGGILVLSNIPTPLSSLSAKYWFTSRLGFQLNFSFLFTEIEEEIPGVREGYVYRLNNAIYEYDIDGRILFNFIRKNYSTFYCAAGAGTLLLDTSTGERDGGHLTVNGAMGTEFFIPWIKEVGTDLEVGLKYRGISPDFSKGSTTSLFVLFGFNYYF